MIADRWWENFERLGLRFKFEVLENRTRGGTVYGSYPVYGTIPLPGRTSLSDTLGP